MYGWINVHKALYLNCQRGIAPFLIISATHVFGQKVPITNKKALGTCSCRNMIFET